MDRSQKTEKKAKKAKKGMDDNNEGPGTTGGSEVIGQQQMEFGVSQTEKQNGNLQDLLENEGSFGGDISSIVIQPLDQD